MATPQPVPKKILDAIEQVLGRGGEEVTHGARLVEDLGADSLDIVELTMALEQAYGVGPVAADVEDQIMVGTVADLILAFEPKAAA